MTHRRKKCLMCAAALLGVIAASPAAAEEPDRLVLVWQDAWLHTAPAADAERARVSGWEPAERVEHPGQLVSMRLVAEHGEYVEVATTVGDPPGQCYPTLGDVVASEGLLAALIGTPGEGGAGEHEVHVLPAGSAVYFSHGRRAGRSYHEYVVYEGEFSPTDDGSLWCRERLLGYEDEHLASTEARGLWLCVKPGDLSVEIRGGGGGTIEDSFSGPLEP